MKYNIVKLQEQKAAGLRIRTNNRKPDLKEEIGKIWKKYFEDGVYNAIPEKKGSESIGLYTNYASDHTGDYDFYVCCPVESVKDLPGEAESITIPAGTYAEFIVKGDAQTAVSEFWGALWDMDLDRKFSGDFEVYKQSEDLNNCEVHVFIALNDSQSSDCRG